MKKLYLLSTLMLFVIAAMQPHNLNAQVSVWDGTYAPWTHGTGTESDPFLIENAQQLAYLAYRVNNGLDAGGGHVSNHDLHYKLMTDVNLNGNQNFQWTPIGYWISNSNYYSFGGHFDGNDHTIYGLFPDSLPSSPASLPIFPENFENGLPPTWSTIDANQDGYNWMFVNGVVGHGGNGYCISSHSHYNGTALTPDNWLITPLISIPNNSSCVLSFWVSAQDASYSAEHYGVYITTTDNTNPINYTLLFEETINATGGARQQGTWAMKSCSLSQYAGQNIRVAFRHFNCTDQFILNIDDVSIDMEPMRTVSSDCVGFFGYTEGSIIENLHFYQDSNSIVNVSSVYFGGIIGHANSTVLNNCSNHGGDIVFSSNNAYVGGIVGYATGSTSIKNCNNTASFLSATSNPGGIVGYANGDVVITSSYNTGTINAIFNSGGIVSLSSGNLSLLNSYNTGNINSISSSSKSGGLVGYSTGSISIENSYNTGSISGISTTGGVIGYSNSGINVTNCYNSGNIICNSYNAGGVIGYGVGQVQNCHYRNNCGGNNTYGGSPQSSAFMQTIGFLDILNNGTCSYEMDTFPFTNQGYPTLTMIYLKANTLDAANVTQSHGTLKGTVSLQNDTLLSAGFMYKENNTTNYTHVICSTATDTLTYTLSGLKPSTSYTYKTYLLSAGCDTTFGTTKTFTTLAIDNWTDYATNITQTHATLNGSFTIGDANMSSYGFEYRKTTDTVFQTVTVSGDGSISETVTGLTPSTQYTYRTFCTAVGCEPIYGYYRDFTTQAVSVTTITATNLTESSATLNGSMAMGDATVTNKGFEYRAVGDTNFITVNATGGTNSFSSTLNNLPVNTFYEYRAFVEIAESTERYYGNLETFEASWLNADTIFVNDATMLQWVSNRCNSGVTFEGKYIKLMNDITLPLNQPNNMTSIGTYPYYPFKGTFDGNGKLITNLYIDQPNTPYQGFFGYTLDANLYEVGLVNITASGRNYTGGMVAYASNTYMRNCYVSGGTLFALSYCGGLVGYQDSGTNSIISGCYNTCTVSGNNYVGGLVGFSNYSTVRNSYVAANVTGQGTGIGAIIGGANAVLMYNCFFSTTITGQNSAIGENNLRTGEGMSDNAMRDSAFVATLNQGLVVPVWKPDYANPINNGFPILIWQASENVQISGNTVICNGASTTLTASSGASYVWSTGATGQSITVSTPGNYSVTVTKSNGNSYTASVNVTAMEPVSIVGNTHICSGQSTTLSTSGTGNYTWSNGSHNASVVITEPGTYTVTVSQSNGCTSSASAVVTAASLPTPAIIGNTSICQGETSTLIATGGNSYAWSNGSTSTNVTISQSGVYTVTATNVEGCSATANVTVTVNPQPNVVIVGDNNFCQGDNITLMAFGADSYSWNTGDSQSSITVINAGAYSVTGTAANGCATIATQTVTMNPTYNITLTHSICQGESYNFFGQNITTAGTYTHTSQTVNGCDSIITLTLTVGSLPTPSITGNTTICEGQATSLTATGGATYAWNNGNTGSSIYVAQGGIYTVTATNLEGCSATASVNLTVNPLPSITITGNTTICQGGSTTLTATGADTYSWSTGNNTATVNISAFGVYTVTGTSAAGCSNTANATVLVSQAPQITITGETDICAGESTTLTANGGTTYLWSNGTTDATLTVSTPGTWQVIGYNEAGCNAMASATVSVWQPATSEFTIECSDPCYTWNAQSYCTSGDYTQTLQTVHGCDSVVTLHLTITVSVDDYDGFDFKVYPNPTSNIVNVQCTMNNVQFGGMELHLCDAYGRLLDVFRANNDSPLRTAQIDLSRYAKGVYFVKAVADGTTAAVRKVVKQ